MRLHVLHTNDLHGRLTAARAEWLAAEKRRLRPCLLLDSGDAVACGNVGWWPSGEWMHDRMNQAGYDAGAVGNREFHFRAGPQSCKTRRALFPLLCTNLVAPLNWGGIRREARLEPVPGLVVRLWGLLVPMITAEHWARRISPVRFVDPAGALAEQAAGEAAVTIVLSHLGLWRDEQLAATAPVDLILGGHSHTAQSPQRLPSGVQLSQNEARGGTVTHLELDIADGRLQNVSGELRAWPV